MNPSLWAKATNSRKFWAALLGLGLVVGLSLAGKLEANTLEGIKWILGPYLLGQGLADMRQGQ